MLHTMASRIIPERTRTSDFGLLFSGVLPGQGVWSLTASSRRGTCVSNSY
jgi:hypothetical protein